MAVGFGIASLVVGIYGTATSQRNQKRSIRDQQAIDALNAANLAAETAESVKRTKQTQDLTQGYVNARVASSGFASGGSLTFAAKTLETQQASDLDWMKTSGASRLNILQAESKARLRLASAETNAAAVKGYVGAFANAYGSYKSAGGKAF